MFINLKVLDSESGSFFETEAILIGDGTAVYNDGGNLSIETVKNVNGSYETELSGRPTERYSMDLSIVDRVSEMAAEDFIALCE